MAQFYSNCNLQLKYRPFGGNSFCGFPTRPGVPLLSGGFQMPRCFLTGIEVQMENACLLDCGAARRAVRDLKLRVAAVERIVEQLSPKDRAEVLDYKSQRIKVRPERRLVCQTVAAALSMSYPESPLFVAWPAFKARRPPLFREFQKRGNGAHEFQGAPDTAATAPNDEAANADSR